MTYQFQIGRDTYIGHTLPGTARIRIFHAKDSRFVVAFDPDVYSLRSKRPCGSWTNIQPETNVSLLETLQPQILSACQARLCFYDEANKRLSANMPAAPDSCTSG